jgi:hypothetical protein
VAWSREGGRSERDVGGAPYLGGQEAGACLGAAVASHGVRRVVAEGIVVRNLLALWWGEE